MRRFVLTVFVGLSFALLNASLAEANATAQSLEQLLIRSAVDAQEHSALASHFRSKAALARAEAEREDKMSRSGVFTPGNAGMQRYHRARRAEKIERHLASAESFEAQARLHEVEAARLADEPQGEDEQARVTR